MMGNLKKIGIVLGLIFISSGLYALETSSEVGTSPEYIQEFEVTPSEVLRCEHNRRAYYKCLSNVNDPEYRPCLDGCLGYSGMELSECTDRCWKSYLWMLDRCLCDNHSSKCLPRDQNLHDAYFGKCRNQQINTSLPIRNPSLLKQLEKNIEAK